VVEDAKNDEVNTFKGLRLFNILLIPIGSFKSPNTAALLHISALLVSMFGFLYVMTIFTVTLPSITEGRENDNHVEKQ
jgi:hypothetical protein